MQRNPVALNVSARSSSERMSVARTLSRLLALGLLTLFLALPAAYGQESTPDTPSGIASFGIASPCLLTPRDNYANVRAQPSVSSPVVTRINTGDQAVGIAKLLDRGETLWYFTPAGWTADIAVRASESCANLFSVSSLALARRQIATILFEAQPGSGEADAYVEQAAIYGDVPHTPAITVHQIEISTPDDQIVCSDFGCDHLTLMLFLPTSGRVTGFFSTTPEPGITPLPPSLDTLLYTSPAECLPLGTVCLVGIVRTPATANAACLPEQFAALLNAAPLTHPADPASESPAVLPLLIQDMREAALQSLDMGSITPVDLPPLGETNPCEFELLIPSSIPGEARFSTLEGGVIGYFDVIRISPPISDTASSAS